MNKQLMSFVGSKLGKDLNVNKMEIQGEEDIEEICDKDYYMWQLNLCRWNSRTEYLKIYEN
jgi:hypothetical protein